jgi:flagellar basal-body rod protein FlgB
MFEKLEIVRMAQAMATHAGARQGAIATNIANADTPGYKAQDMPDFAESFAKGADTALRMTRAGHIGAQGGNPQLIARTTGGAAAPNGNTVSLESEMVKAVEVRQQHDMALAIYRSTSSILRTSLGRK